MAKMIATAAFLEVIKLETLELVVVQTATADAGNEVSHNPYLFLAARAAGGSETP